MVLLPLSTLATYVPEGDHDTELMAELEKKNRVSHVTTFSQVKLKCPIRSRVIRLQLLLTCGFGPECDQASPSARSKHRGRHQLILQPHKRRQD